MWSPFMNKPLGPGEARADIPAALKLVPPAQPAQVRKRLPKSWIIGGLLALAVVAAIALAWWSLSPGASVRYATAPVTRGAVTRAVVATGTVNPVLTIIVGSYVSGVIQSLNCDYNTQVKEGQVCAKIDPRPYQTVVDQNQANLAVAQAQLEKDKASLDYAQLNYDRNARLSQTNAVSKDALDIAKSTLDQARAQIGVDEATIEQRQAQLEAAQVSLGYTDIVSPVNGTVVSRNVTVGQTVAASFQTPTLFLIATDLTKMQVDTNVSESDIGDIKEGDKAYFTVDAFPRRTFEGAVTQVRQSPQNIQNVVTYDVVVGVNNTDLALKPGMTAASRIVTEERTDVLRVPSQALRYAPAATRPAAARGGTSPAAKPATSADANQGAVWVLRDGKPIRVAIVAGLDDDSHAEIVSGDVKPGDRVIIAEQRSSANNASAAANGIPRPRF
jgi:HlyD family secretion protein